MNRMRLLPICIVWVPVCTALPGCGNADDPAEQSTASDGSAGPQDASPDATAPDDGEHTDTASDVDPACSDAASHTASFPKPLLDQTVEWKSCPLDEAKGTGDGECTDIRVPLFWDQPEGETIPLRIKRKLGPAPHLRQLWVNEGGPGGSSVTDFGPIMQDWTSYFQADIYAMDQRGTGQSTRMGCPDQESESSEGGFFITDQEWPACIDYLKNQWHDTDAFTVTQTAKDHAFVVELFRPPCGRVFYYGVSYGTYLGYRYAQLYPNQADAILLDSMVPSDGCHLDQLDENGIVTVHKVFDACSSDPFCNGKMGGKAEDTAFAALESFAQGACAKLKANVAPDAPADAYMRILAAVLAEDWYARTLMVAAYYRLARCTDDDVAALTNLFGTVLGMGPAAPAGKSDVYDRAQSMALFYHVAFAELTSGQPPDPVSRWYDSLGRVASTFLDYRVSNVAKLGLWPVAPTDSFHHQWAPAEARMLIVNGTLDYQTPIELASLVKPHLQAPAQHFVEVPLANHCVLRQSPVQTAGARPCGMQIAKSWFDDPGLPPDTSCIADLRPLEFTGSAAYGAALMGTEDIWEGVPTVQSKPLLQAETDVETIRERFRRKRPGL